MDDYKSPRPNKTYKGKWTMNDPKLPDESYLTFCKLQGLPHTYFEEIVRDRANKVSDKELGHKIEKGKLDLSQLPWQALCEVAKVFHFGLKEHPKDSWKKGFRESTCDASYLRHQLQFRFGMNEDEKSNLPHLAHAAWWALVKLELYLKGTLVRDIKEDIKDLDNLFYEVDDGK